MVVARGLGPEELGRYSYALFVITLCTAATDFGLSAAQFYNLAEARERDTLSILVALLPTWAWPRALLFSPAALFLDQGVGGALLALGVAISIGTGAWAMTVSAIQSFTLAQRRRHRRYLRGCYHDKRLRCHHRGVDPHALELALRTRSVVSAASDHIGAQLQFARVSRGWRPRDLIDSAPPTP